MAGPQFHETGYGRRFLNDQLPHLIETLGAIAHELKRLNDREDSHEPCQAPDVDFGQHSKLAQRLGQIFQAGDEDEEEDVQPESPKPVILKSSTKLHTADHRFWVGQKVIMMNRSCGSHDQHEGIIASLHDSYAWVLPLALDYQDAGCPMSKVRFLDMIGTF